jgi:hypothetical protein
LRVNYFLNKFIELYQSSRPQNIDGEMEETPVLWVINIFNFKLENHKTNPFSVANVYTRINNIGKSRFKINGAKLILLFCKMFLELVWLDLEDWSKKLNKSKDIRFLVCKT